MAQALGGFYVGPADYSRGFDNLTQAAEINQNQKRMQEQSDYQANAKQALTQAVRSGDPAAMRDAVIQFPEIADTAKQAFGFTNEATEKVARETYRRVLSDPANAFQLMSAGADEVERLGGRPRMMRSDAQMFQENPEAALRNVRAGFAAIASDQEYESMFPKASSGVTSPSNVREYEYYTSLDDAGKRDFLTMKRASQGFQQGDVQMTQDPTNPRFASPVIEQGQGQGTQASMQETATEQVATQAASVKAAEQSIDQSQKMFERLGKVTTAENNLNEAIRLVDSGAETGPVISMLPSVTQASVELDNLQGQMGLDVIGSTTFGALSKDELLFALNTALPTKLQGQPLRNWLVRKRDSQKKLKLYIEEAAIFLGKPGNTIPKFLEMKKGGGAEGAMDRKTADDFINSALST
jgi:hypothetical protein